jgi:hypothetical protein
MDNWRRLGISVSCVIGTLLTIQAAGAASSQCDGYGGCEQLEILPPVQSVRRPENAKPSVNAEAKPSEDEAALRNRADELERTRSNYHERYSHRASTSRERTEVKLWNRKASQKKHSWIGAPAARRSVRPPLRRQDVEIHNQSNYDEWLLHRPSTFKEREQTKTLNREASQSGGNWDGGAIAQPNYDYFRLQRQYELQLREYFSALRAYNSQTKSHPGWPNQPNHTTEPYSYQAAPSPSVEDYNQWPKPPSGNLDSRRAPPARAFAPPRTDYDRWVESHPGDQPPPPRQAGTAPPPVSDYRRWPAPPSYEQERLDPWHGYSSGPNNGY